MDRDIHCELALGGYSFPIQDDPCDRSADADEQLILLARAECELVYEPFQCVAYWLIRRRDLIKRNFDNVAFHMQCDM